MRCVRRVVGECALLVLLAMPMDARAQERELRVSICVPEEDGAAVRRAAEIELARPLEECGAPGVDLEVRVHRDGLLEGLDIEVRGDGRVLRSERTTLPQDEVDPRAVAVIIASLVQSAREELAAPPPDIPEPPSASVADHRPTTSPQAAPREASLDDASIDQPPIDQPAVDQPAVDQPAVDETAVDRAAPHADEPAPAAFVDRRTRLGFGVTVAFGADARWLDAGDTFTRDSEAHALAGGADVRFHDPSGHGAALSLRWGSFVFGPGPPGRESFHADLRYAYRATDPALPLVLLVELGVSLVQSYRLAEAEETTVGTTSLGPIAAIAGFVELASWVLGLELAYSALIGTRDATYGHGLELYLRTGFFFDRAVAVGRGPDDQPQ